MGRVDRATDFLKGRLQRGNRETLPTAKGDAAVRAAVLANACDDRIRRNGFAPDQRALGGISRSARVTRPSDAK